MDGKVAISASKWSFSAKGLGRVPKPRTVIMIVLKSSWTAKAAFVASIQMAGVKPRHLRSRNVMRSTRCAVKNKGITLRDSKFAFLKSKRFRREMSLKFTSTAKSKKTGKWSDESPLSLNWGPVVFGTGVFVRTRSKMLLPLVGCSTDWNKQKSIQKLAKEESSPGDAKPDPSLYAREVKITYYDNRVVMTKIQGS